MKYKKVIAVLSGLLLVTAISIVCASQYIVNKTIPSTEGYKNKSEHSSSVQMVYTTNIIKADILSDESYNKLDFSDINSFINSLVNTMELNNADVLYEERLYDSSEEDIVSLYHNSDSNISVAVLPDNSISYCSFKNLTDEQQNQLKSLSKGTGYNFKVVSNGCILEPDITVL